MKKNIDKYELATTLPGDALTVGAHCELEGYTTAYLYKLVKEEREGKRNNDFKIVVFQGINFITRK